MAHRHPSYVSPRNRAKRTLELLHIGCEDRLPWERQHVPDEQQLHSNAPVEISESIREWDYGQYEGLTSVEIRRLRMKEGMAGYWDIWRDGCPGGEYVGVCDGSRSIWAADAILCIRDRSPEQVTQRLDRVIADIRHRFHGPAMNGSEGKSPAADVLLVAHGHILRAFAMRWVGKSLQENPSLILEAGGVGTLRWVIYPRFALFCSTELTNFISSYEHHSIEEPAILLGGSFMVDVVESATSNAEK